MVDDRSSDNLTHVKGLTSGTNVCAYVLSVLGFSQQPLGCPRESTHLLGLHGL